MTDLAIASLAQLYIEKEDVESAKHYLQMIVVPIYEIGIVLGKYAAVLQKLKRYNEAINAYKKCIRICPDATYLYTHLSHAYKAIGQHEEAKRYEDVTILSSV